MKFLIVALTVVMLSCVRATRSIRSAGARRTRMACRGRTTMCESVVRKVNANATTQIAQSEETDDPRH